MVLKLIKTAYKISHVLPPTYFQTGTWKDRSPLSVPAGAGSVSKKSASRPAKRPSRCGSPAVLSRAKITSRTQTLAIIIIIIIRPRSADMVSERQRPTGRR